MFARKKNPIIPKFDFKRTLIDYFLESVPKRGVDLHRAPNDSSGQFAIDELCVDVRMIHVPIKEIK